MLIQELIALTESNEPSSLFAKMIEGKKFALIDLSAIHAKRGNPEEYVLQGSIETFNTVDEMTNFLILDEENESESRILSTGLSDSDKKKLKWPAGHDDEDKELFIELASNLDPREFLKLDAVKNTHDNGDVDGDNYDWQILVMDGKRTNNMSGIEDFVYERVEE